jgi:hypothetical protein
MHVPGQVDRLAAWTRNSYPDNAADGEAFGDSPSNGTLFAESIQYPRNITRYVPNYAIPSWRRAVEAAVERNERVTRPTKRQRTRAAVERRQVKLEIKRNGVRLQEYIIVSIIIEH